MKSEEGASDTAVRLRKGGEEDEGVKGNGFEKWRKREEDEVSQ